MRTSMLENSINRVKIFKMLNFTTAPRYWKMWKILSIKGYLVKHLTSWLFKCLIAVGSNGAAVVLEVVRKLENISQQFQNLY